jgi:flagellar biosynthetic protein FliQ
MEMTPETTIGTVQKAIEVTMLISAPLLLSALIVGLVVSIFQAATQINEMTLSFIPKLLTMVIVMVLAGPWMTQTMMDYMTRLYTSIPHMID